MRTPTPYTANVADTRELEPGKYVREVLISGPHFTPDEMGAAAVDAAFIVKACNMHEKLVSLLAELGTDIDSDYIANHSVRAGQRRQRYLIQIRALLAKANE